MDIMYLLIGTVIVIGIIFILQKILVSIFSSTFKKEPNINEFSYQRYAKFYDNTTFKDDNFNEKIFRISSLIKEGKRDIKEIANLTGCSLEECILKIKYLQNKKQFLNIHIDKKAYELIECSAEDMKLIKKYTPYIYYNHFTIDEIATKIRRSSYQDFNKLREEIYNEIYYLYQNDLINGIKINEVDKEIVYYSLEKKKVRDYITIRCPNCGALNDVNRGSKVRCEYCDSIIEDNSNKD